MAFLIAAASSNGKTIDRHFGHSDIFYIVAVKDDGSYEIKEKREVRSPCNHGSHDDNAMQQAVSTLTDCRYVLAEAVGRGAAAQLEVKGITPLESDESIDTAVKQIIVYDNRLHRRKK